MTSFTLDCFALVDMSSTEISAASDDKSRHTPMKKETITYSPDISFFDLWESRGTTDMSMS
jgi:hypothetical protein